MIIRNEKEHSQQNVKILLVQVTLLMVDLLQH